MAERKGIQCSDTDLLSRSIVDLGLQQFTNQQYVADDVDC